MKKLLFVVILCSYSFTFSQIRFEKGYLINNQDVKSEVLIKNEDWTLNPTEFFY